ncbi:MAG: glycosyltransferase [Pirellulales bacterium]|nr:glycosyltransferase [Pirellulales bacterium]
MPKVSVIIPNYNYACFLRRRLESVLGQTLSDIEVFLLDDASQDESLQIAAEYLSDPRLRIFYNETNGGTFLQWRRGLRHCTGEYVWIAEADDVADPRLLETLVERLERHPQIGLAYCQSWNVNEEGLILGSNLAYTQGLDPERWKRDYVCSGNEECSRALLFMNTIPNASAAVFRREVCRRVGGPGTRFRLSGDWDLWLRIVLASGVAYVAEPLNYYRTHVQTVRSATTQNGLWIEEMAQIIAEFLPRMNLPPEGRARLAEHFRKIWLEACEPRMVPWRRHWRIYRATRTFAPEIGRRTLYSIFRRRLQRSATVTK